MTLPGLLVVEDRVTKLALYQALGRRRPFLKIKTIRRNKGRNKRKGLQFFIYFRGISVSLESVIAGFNCISP